jgi:hypothetical protein
MFGGHSSSFIVPPGTPVISIGPCLPNGVGGYYRNCIWQNVVGEWFPGDEITVYISSDNITFSVLSGPVLPGSLPYLIPINVPAISLFYIKALVTRRGINGAFCATQLSNICP